MKSVTTEQFRKQYAPASTRQQAQINNSDKLWRENPAHSSIRFEKVHATEPIFSARVDLDWRAHGVLDDDTIVWFWVGLHDEYDALLKRT